MRNKYVRYWMVILCILAAMTELVYAESVETFLAQDEQPRIGDTQEYVEACWGEYMNPSTFLFSTTYEKNVYLPSADHPFISVDYWQYNWESSVLSDMTIHLAEHGLEMELDQAVVLAKRFIDEAFLKEHYYSSKAQHYVTEDGRGYYYQSFVWMDQTRHDLPPCIVVGFHHDEDGIVNQISITGKEPRTWYRNDERIFSDWDLVIWSDIQKKE